MWYQSCNWESFMWRGPAWVDGNVTKWYQSPVFNTDPGWADLAEC
jgi:hypothetical protein